MITLLIDTTTTTLSVALLKDKKIISKISESTNRNQSEILAVRIDELLKKENIKLKEVNEIYVTVGPGSFTGVRLGLTFAKTVCQLNNIPLRYIDTLSAMNGKGSNSIYVDARSNQAFYAKFEQGKMNGQIELINYEGSFEMYDIVEGMIQNYDDAKVTTDIFNINPIYIKDSNAKKLNEN